MEIGCKAMVGTPGHPHAIAAFNTLGESMNTQWQRPVLQVHQIEITSECNLRCQYCPHPKMVRPKEHMTSDVWYQALDWVRYFVDKGTQGEVSLTGMGEGTLHPKMPEMLRQLRGVLGHVAHRPIVFSTNGIKPPSEELLDAIKETGALVYLSAHRPERVGRTLQVYRQAGVLPEVHANFIDNGFDWAGQVNWPVTITKEIECQFLRRRLDCDTLRWAYFGVLPRLRG